MSLELLRSPRRPGSSQLGNHSRTYPADSSRSVANGQKAGTEGMYTKSICSSQVCNWTNLLQRDFGLLSIFGFSMVLMCSWETILARRFILALEPFLHPTLFLQITGRRFEPFSVGICEKKRLCILTSCVAVSYMGLVDGGTAGLIWMFFICWIGFMLVNTSMAEMGSM